MTEHETTFQAITQHRCSAILSTPLPDAVAPAMQAAVDGGFKIVEFTLTTPGALEQIREFSRKDDLIVGAGTVLTVEEAEQAVEAGARFIVSPICDPRVIGWAAENRIVSIPGTYTATEMMTAHPLRAAGDKHAPVFQAKVHGVLLCSGAGAMIRQVACLAILPTLAGTTCTGARRRAIVRRNGPGHSVSTVFPRRSHARKLISMRGRRISE